jgi:hypothetical protein
MYPSNLDWIACGRMLRFRYLSAQAAKRGKEGHSATFRGFLALEAVATDTNRCNTSST